MPILVDYLFYRITMNQVRYIDIDLLSSIHLFGRNTVTVKLFQVENYFLFLKQVRFLNVKWRMYFFPNYNILIMKVCTYAFFFPSISIELHYHRLSINILRLQIFLSRERSTVISPKRDVEGFSIKYFERINEKKTFARFLYIHMAQIYHTSIT